MFFSPAGIYLLKVNNGITKTVCEIFSKLVIKKSEQHCGRKKLANYSPSHYHSSTIVFEIHGISKVVLSNLFLLVISS